MRVFLDPTPERLDEMYRNHQRQLGHFVPDDATIPASREDLRRHYRQSLESGDTRLLNDSARKPIGG